MAIGISARWVLTVERSGKGRAEMRTGLQTGIQATAIAVTAMKRRVRFVVRGAWHEGELVDAGCTWRIVRADDSGHRMLLPASDVREEQRKVGEEAGETNGE